MASDAGGYDVSVESVANGEPFDLVEVVREVCRRVLELERERLDRGVLDRGGTKTTKVAKGEGARGVKSAEAVEV